MAKNDQKSTNKGRNKPEVGDQKSEEAKAERLKAKGLKRSDVGDQKSEEVKAERLKAKGIKKSDVGSPKSEEETHSAVGTPHSELREHSALDIPYSALKEHSALKETLTTDMEVHHHPQLDHKPKPWKEYLLEGLMIFIAVMMGFIAENIRENITNNEHARQLTSQLVRDLRADTTQLNEICKAETQIVKNNDTLFNLLQQPLEKADTKRIQKLIAGSHSMWLFHPSSAGAIAAIKNELHLKQFSDSEIIGYFATYERHLELLYTAQDINLQYQRIYLDPFLTQHFTPANMVAAFDDHSVPTTQMRNLTQGDLDQLAADVVLIRIVSKEMVRHNRSLKNDVADLLQYVIKQYKLKD